MANDFIISLGGKINIDTVNSSIKAINADVAKLTPLKLKIDTNYIQRQLDSLTANISSATTKLPSIKDSLVPPTKLSTKDIIEQNTGLSQNTELKRLNAYYTKLQEKADLKLASSKKTLTTQTENYQSRLISLKNSGALTQKEFDKFNAELAEIKKNLATGDVDKFKTEFQQLKNKTSETSAEMMTFGERTKTAFSAMTQWMTASTIFFGIVRAIKDLVAQVIELDKAFTNLQIVTKYTNQQMEGLKQSYIDLAKEMGVTVNALVEGADEWLRAGLSVEDTMDGIKASTTLATVAQMDNATATQYLIAQMNAYNLTAKDLISLVDKMSAVDVVAATSSAELGEAISLTAKSAQLAGIGYDKLLGMIATVSETTRQSASSIGNS